MQNEHVKEPIIDDLCNKMLSEHDAIVQKRASRLYKTWIPDLYSFYQITKKAWIKKLLNTIFKATFNLKTINNNIKYIFFGLRHEVILKGLPREEILIIARNKSEIAYALKNKITFISGQNITYYFLLAYFEGKTDKLKKEIYKFFDLFSSKESKCYLILTSDTKADDIFISSLACHFNDIFRVLCIQHAEILDYIYPNFYVAEGERTPFNILYNESQRKVASKYIKNSGLVVMGPPWNLPRVLPQGDREVILVGTHDSYDKNIAIVDVFKALSELLKADKIGHTYRPHPFTAPPDGYFDSIDSRTEAELLSGAPKIVVGFISTLMYKAYISGHTVYSIDMNPDWKLTCAVDGVFTVAELPALSSLISGQVIVQKKLRDPLLPLHERFIKALSDVEDIITKRQIYN